MHPMRTKRAATAVLSFAFLYVSACVLNNNGAILAVVTVVRRRSLRTLADATEGKERKLEFVHIPKTGGSAIERAGGHAGTTWGACRYVDLNRIYDGKEDFGPGCSNVLGKGNMKMKSNIPYIHEENPLWHLPFHWFENHPYQNRTTFVVVRDPYAKVVSTYRCRWNGYQNKREPHHPDGGTASHMNRWIVNKLRDPVEQKRRQTDSSSSSESSMHRQAAPIQIFSHAWIPQTSYVYDPNTNEKVVDHVLKFETLKDDFPNLMSEYGIEAELKEERTNAGSGKRLTPLDLTDEAKDLIREFYHEDFEMFGYPTDISEKKQSQNHGGRKLNGVSLMEEYNYEGDTVPPEYYLSRIGGLHE